MNKIFILLGLLGFFLGTLIKISDAAEPPWEQAEKFVIDQVSKGKAANLLQQFSGKSENFRQLRSKEFIEKLLTNSLEGIKVGRHGVKIIGAVIFEPLNLENADIRNEIWLLHCKFKEKVQFALSTFTKGPSFIGSVFHKAAEFADMMVVGNLYLMGTEFIGPTFFNGARVLGQFQASSAKFLFKPTKNSDRSVIYSANFNHLQVQGDMFFNNAIFDGPATFAKINAGGDIHFDNAKLEGSLDFNGSKINGQFLADNTQFLSKKSFLDFRGDQGR